MTVSRELTCEFAPSWLDRRMALGAAISCGLALSGLVRPAMAFQGVRMLVSPEHLRPAYDYVIVGAGSAGCVLAHRIGKAGRRVLLIEAGGPAKLAAIADPPAWPELQDSQVDWRYSTIPQPGLSGRIVAYPRGKVDSGIEGADQRLDHRLVDARFFLSQLYDSGAPLFGATKFMVHFIGFHCGRLICPSPEP